MQAGVPSNTYVPLFIEMSLNAEITRHEYRYKTVGGAYPATWTAIADSASGGANAYGYTVAGLSNETVYKFQLRTVGVGGNGRPVTSNAVTPTPGICDRTPQVRDAIVAEVDGVDDCAHVSRAHLAAIRRLDDHGRGTIRKGIESLSVNDFAGLTNLDTLNLVANELTKLPTGVFAGLTNLVVLYLSDNRLTEVHAGEFAGLTKLTYFGVSDNQLTEIPGDLFAGQPYLDAIRIRNNRLSTLPDGLFAGRASPGLLFVDGNTVDPLPLTVTLEPVGLDQVRAKVPAGAPFEMRLPVTVTDGALADGLTTLTVAAGSVESTPVTVYRTAGTGGAVTVDLGTPLPSPPELHWGYVLTPAASGLPVTVPAAQIAPAAPVEENTTAVRTLRASDAGGGTVTWSKTGGADAARFALTAAGVLTFVSAPDYEAPADVASADPRNDAANNEYVVFVTPSDGTELRLVVRVINVNEAPTAGTVTIDGMTPAVGVTLTATVAGLVDPDGLPEPFTTLSWQWYRTPTGGSETVIPGAIGATYTAAAADLGATLTAKATYTDGGGFDNTLASDSTAAVLPNTAPVIKTTSPVAVAENGTAVATLAASDADGDPIAWSKTGGADADRFALSAQGVLTFKAEPDYESPADVASADPANDAENNEYVVFVTASDGTDDTELQLVVRVTNANDAPTGTVTIDDTSPMIGDVLTARAVDVADPDGLPDSYELAWQWYRTLTGGSETEIDGATAATYTVVAADYDATLTAKATWTDNGGFTNTLASAATEVTPRTSCTENPGDIWCGVVTVERIPLLVFGEVSDGYVAAFPAFMTPQFGDLSNKNFTYDGTRYTIDTIAVSPPVLTSYGGVYFSLDRALPRNAREALLLYIGPTSRNSSPSGVTSLSGFNASVDYEETSHTFYWRPDGQTDVGESDLGPGVDWSSQAAVTVRLRENAPPVFTSAAAFTVNENETTVGEVTATDADPGDTYLRYEITGGTDRYESDGTTERFEIDDTSGELSFKSAPNYEDPQDAGADNTYEVVVEARSGMDLKKNSERGITNRTPQPITVTVTDADEQSAKPAKPTLAAVAGSSTSLRASWTKPDLNGGPEITGYNVQYKVNTATTWEDFAHSDTAVTTTITGLTADTSYQVQVRAKNGETDSDWSDPSDAVSTNAATPGTTPTLSIADAAASEGSNVTFTVTLSEADAADVTATWTASIETDDTAVAADLGTTKTGTVTVAAGNMMGTFEVPVVNDATDEGDETFTVTLSSPSSNAKLETDPTATGTIEDDDAAMTPTSCTLNTGDIWCGVVTVGAIKTTDDALVGHGFVEAGGLSAGSLAGNPDDTMFSVGGNDYTIQGVYIQVPTADHLTGTLFVLLSANLTDDDKAGLLLPVDGTTTPFEFSGATIGTTGLYSWGLSGLTWSAEDTVTIRVRPRTLSVADASDAENDGKVEFTVTLSEAAATAVTATWTASIETDDTAVAADLGTTKTGTVTVAAGNMMGTFEVPVVNDATDEGDETFTVTLSSPSSNAKLETDPTATGTIEDDDAAMPTISAVAVTSTPVLETDTYGAGETIEVSVTFNEAVTATSDTDFVLSVAGASRAPLVRGSGTATLVFGYTVVSSDEDDDGIWIGDQDRTLVGNRNGDPQNGTITSVATSTAADLTHAELGQQSDHKVDGSRSIVSVAVSSTPMLETDTYGAGETIRFTVTFNVPVDVSGDPVLAFALGNQGDVRDVDAAHESGSGTTALVFAYTVVSTDEDSNGIFLRDEDDFDDPDGPVRLDSDDTIQFTGTSTDVPLYWQGRGTQSGHKVEGSRTTGNNAPVFTSSASLSVEENTDFATVVAVDNDADDDITGYAITGGTDQLFFSEVTSAGVLSFNDAPNFEDPKDSGTDNTYVVTVQATSGTGTREMTASQTITVTVTDALEKSAKPDKPTLAKVTGSSTSLTATWTKPDLNGGPDITGYAVQYKVNTATTWEDFAHSDTAVTTTITGLTADTSYQVQVRAKNGETDSDWSDPSDAVRTSAVDMPIPPGLEVTLHLSADEPLENAGWIPVTATVSPASPVAFTVTVSASPVAPATDADFRLSSNLVLSFAADATESTGVVRIGLVDDDNPEPDDVVRVSGAVSNTAIPDPDDVTLTIVNDDPEDFDVAVSAPAAVDEDAGMATVTVALTTRKNSAPVIDVDLYYYWRPETATRGEDYRPPPGEVFVSHVLFDTVPTSAFSPNAAGTAWETERTFEIGIVDDPEAEGNETIVFRVATSSDSSPNHTIILRDDDTPVLRNVTLVSGPGSDGVWRTGERVDVEARYSLPVVVERPDCWTLDAEGTCRPPGPYMLVAFRSDARPGYGAGPAPLAPYVGGSGTATLRFAHTVGAAEDGALRVVVGENGIFLRGATIRPPGGGDVELSEYTNTRVLQVDVVRTGGGVWTAGDTVLVKVRFAGPVQYTPPDQPQNRDEVFVDERRGTPTIRLRLGEAPNPRLPRTARYERGSGTDTLTFEYAVTAGDGRVSAVEAVADSLARNGATIRNEDGYDAELNHVDVLWYSWLALRVRHATAREGEPLRFTMELARASLAPVTVDYETADGTATAGEDYTAKRGTVTFTPGRTRRTVEVPVLRDGKAEGVETMVLRLSNARSEGSEVPVEMKVSEARGAIENVAPEVNTPAAGVPTINGTAQVGETLTAGTSGIADQNGLENATFSYQWLADHAKIAGANSSTRTLTDVDQGKAIRVRVSFTDDAGHWETLTSAPTEPVLEEPVFGDGPPGAPRNLTATAGDQEITLSWEPPEDNGNPPATRYRIEWRIDGKDYKKGHWGTAGSTTYTKTDLANGVNYIFRVKAENGSGNSYGPYGPASEEVSATPTSGSAVDLGTPVLSNTKTLHHGMVQLDWEDIEDAGWYVVQYYHVKSGEWLDLPAAGVDMAFHGSSAVVSNLHGLSWLRVRAMSCAGESEWSQIEELYGTNASDWDGVPVPEVAEGDQIDPCPVILGTPVLSNTKTLHHGMVRLDWQDIEDAGWYVVQYYHVKSGEWLDLPAEGVDIAFHGSSAVVSNLHGLSWLRVRAMSCAGESEWSQIEELYGTNASDWEGVPVPEVAEGDEIEPCSEDADTPANSPATGAPTISGTAHVGETLTAGTSGIADEDGLENVSFSYQWLSDDAEITGAIGSTYTLTDSEEGKAVKIEVSFTDDEGNNETLTSVATAAVTAEPAPNNPATGAPTISGTAQVGETLTADTSGIADADGLANATFSYQWLADDSDIAGAAGSTYTPVAVDEGKDIKVQVSFTDDSGNDEELTSAATDAVAAAPTPNNPATGAPTISGTAQVGQTLTANTSGVADADGLSNVQYEHQWLADDADISGATNATYTPVAFDEGKVIKVRVSFTDDEGNEETLASGATDAVSAAPTPNSPATGAPTISGTARVGETLTANTSGIADADGLSNVQYEYQWLADDADISGATGSTYTLADAEEGKAIKVKVTFTDDADNEESLISAATDAVAAAEPSEPPAKPKGLEATATHDSVTLTWDDPQDESITGYVILRRVRENDQGGDFSVLVANTGSAATTYTDDSVKASTTYTYRIKAINGAGTSERSRWVHIDTPAAHGQVVLTWDDPDDDSITGYVILRRIPGVDPEAQFSELVSNTGTAAATYTDASVAAETRYTYRIKAINAHGTSERSRWYHIDTPAAP